MEPLAERREEVLYSAMSDLSRIRRQHVTGAALLGLTLSLAPGSVAPASAEQAAATEPAARFPYDPVCPWGRISDGRGLLVRCLEQEEAQRLSLPPRAASSSAREAPPAMAVAPLDMSPKAPGDAALDAAAPPRRVVVTEVGQARADTGELPEAQRQLRRPLDRYVQCVESNGGLTADSGQVKLRFLVRERGRAEGVAVKERRGMSVEAAKCVADVVDRRYVGYPAAPIVGATLSIEFAALGAAR